MTAKTIITLAIICLGVGFFILKNRAKKQIQPLNKTTIYTFMLAMLGLSFFGYFYEAQESRPFSLDEIAQQIKSAHPLPHDLGNGLTLKNVYATGDKLVMSHQVNTDSVGFDREAFKQTLTEEVNVLLCASASTPGFKKHNLELAYEFVFTDGFNTVINFAAADCPLIK